ncbi:MAG: Response regulator GacA [Verrucomicrobiae bacterium]|nr:Response regulator GacA [Verrucomicrobiae bacterium]
MRILITDDHPLFRIALKHILADEFPTAEFGEACNTQETLALVREKDWAVLVLDLTLPGRSGLDILGELKEARPKLPILILTSQPEELFGLRCLKAGADGYLSKETAVQELVGAVRQVIIGRKFITAAMAEKLAARLSDSHCPPHELLSDREFQVLGPLAAGKAPKEIGADLGLSVKTISTYRARILAKLRLESNADLTRYALQHNLIS